jgi:hypothetical protein
MKNTYRGLVADPVGKRPLGVGEGLGMAVYIYIYGRNIKMAVKDMRCDCTDWIHRPVAQWRAFVNPIVNLGFT